MPRRTYGPLAVFSAGGSGLPDQVLEGEEGGIFSETLNGPALPLFDFNDESIPSITSSPAGQAQWRVDQDGLAGWVRFGEVSVRVVSNDIEALLQRYEDLAVGLEAAPAILPAGGTSGDVLYRAGERQGQWAPAPAGGGTGGVVDWNDPSSILNKPDTFPPSSHQHTAGQISDSTTVGRAVLTALDAQKAREAIGAGTGSGTSNLALGSTGTTAAPGNHSHFASTLTFIPTGPLTAQNVQDAILQAANTGGVSGASQILIWRYSAGGWPTLPTTKPSGVLKVEAIGPSYPTTLPGWVGLAAAQVPLSYSKVAVQ